MKTATRQHIQKECNAFYKASTILMKYHKTHMGIDTADSDGLTSVHVYLQHLVVASTNEDFTQVANMLQELFDTGVFKGNHVITFLLDNVLMCIHGNLMSDEYEQEEQKSSGDWIGNVYSCETDNC